MADKETEYAVTIIQFSGVKKLEASYIPGSLGASGRVLKSLENIKCNFLFDFRPKLKELRELDISELKSNQHF